MNSSILNSAVTASGFTFQALQNKAGKVTRTAQFQAEALNSLSRAAALGVALTGRGAMRKRAAEVFARDAVTLADYSAAAAQGVAIDGSRWGELRGLLAAELGCGNMVAERGKAGCVKLCESATLAAERRLLHAETDKQQDSAARRVARVAELSAMVQTLLGLSEAARVAAEQAAKDQQSEPAPQS